MKTKKDLIFPPIPNEFSAEAKKFFESLFKMMKEMNQNIFSDLQNTSVQTTDTLTTSNREGFRDVKRPTNPPVGYMYIDTSGATVYLYACVRYDRAGDVLTPVWRRIALGAEE